MRASLMLQRRLAQLLELLLIAVMIGLVATIAVQVFSRYVLGSPVPWTEELARYLLVYLTFVGCALAIHEHAHLRIDVLLVRFPVQLQRVIGLLTTASLLITAVLLVWYGIVFTELSWGTVSPALAQSIAWIYAAMPVTGAVMACYLVPQLIDRITHWNDYPRAIPDGDEPGAASPAGQEGAAS
ncbi:TRAP-type C4-dicarboxylate transport system permease small subunit [Pseudonocardia kunmingensis]|uniref:TRAP-type C4-dicarboxylate transport system permease small subunit n=1 Tax=Pseudonocardia kunmingensis TaxID=630975 RepID=A0A543DVM8_9PSEU|nr:TRAP-type C4-dicarboxylate transport system permease small subunit [Pseudonocardia kunmingensis]